MTVCAAKDKLLKAVAEFKREDISYDHVFSAMYDLIDAVALRDDEDDKKRKESVS